MSSLAAMRRPTTRKPRDMRILLLLLGALALAVGTTAGVLLRPTAHGRASGAVPLETPMLPPTADGHVFWTHLWTKPTPDLVDASVSDDGATVAWVDNRGAVRRIAGDSGKTLWQAQKIDGLNRVVAAANGNVYAYSLCNPTQPSVQLFPSTSAKPAAAIVTPRVVAYPVDGAVWSLTTCENRAGAGYVAIGTGHSLIYVLPIAAPSPVASPPVAPVSASPLPVRFTVPGIPDSLAISGDPSASASPTILVGSRESASVSAWTVAGQRLWQPYNISQKNRDLNVRISADGSIAAAISARRPRGTDAHLLMWDGRNGALIRNEDLRGDDARLLVSPHGNFVAVSYRSQAVSNPAESRRIALFDRSGDRPPHFPDSGGRYFAPQLAALSVGGGQARITVRDDDGFIWTLDDHHTYRSRFQLPANSETKVLPTIERTLSSVDGRYLLIQRSDGQISLFKARDGA